MNDKLTIQELAAYLPWEVEVRYKDCMSDKYKKALLTGINKLDIETTYKRKINGCVGDIISFKGNNNIDDLNFKILLLPLSHLTKPKNGTDGITWFDDICWNLFDSRTPDNYECSKIVLNELLQADKVQIDTYYGLVEYLLKNHFDLFGLIKRGIAIDKTTIQ